MSARSCAKVASLPAATSSPAIATTKVLPRCAWMYGATERNQGTKVGGKTRLTALHRSGGNRRRFLHGHPRHAPGPTPSNGAETRWLSVAAAQVGRFHGRVV